jgi:Phosphotransferase enzyme family
MTALVSERADEDALRQCVERIVRDRCGGRPAIVGIHRQRFPRATSYPCDVVTVKLATGEELKIFLKNFGTSQLPKDGLPQRRERELCVYRDLLVDADLGTATYYGSVWDESHGRFWLLLELVPGMPLRVYDVDSWVAAAAWLGRMQRHFAQQTPRLQACDGLLRHDTRFFWSKAEGALQAVSRNSPPLAGRLAHIVNRYDQIVDVMADQPLTLVHGSYRPTNIMVTVNSAPPKVCPTDWELAALGAPLYDLAFLSDSCEPATRDRLWNAYEAEATGCGLALREREDMRYVVDCFRLHKVIKSLSESLDRGFPERTVAKLIEFGERLSNLVLASPTVRVSLSGASAKRDQTRRSGGTPGRQSLA